VDGPNGLAFDSATGVLYWVNYSGNTIGYAHLNGSGEGNLSIAGATIDQPSGLAIDSATGVVYWANDGNNTIGYANVNGSGGGTLTTTGATIDSPGSVAVDPSTALIYWTNDTGNTVSFASLAGSGGGTLSTTGATVDDASGLAVDPVTGLIYWANTGDATIGFASLYGTGGGDLNTSGATINQPYGVAVDPLTGRVYWTNYTSAQVVSFASVYGSNGGNLGTTGASANEAEDPVLVQTPTATTAPLISGGALTGATLSCTQGSWASNFDAAFDFVSPQSYAYQWSDNGVALGAATGTITATTPGSYTCTVTASNQAGSTSQTSAPLTVTEAPTDTGPQGAAGPPGKIDLVTCKTVKRKKHHKTISRQRCVSRLTSSPEKFTTAARAILMRRGRIYATGLLRDNRLALTANTRPPAGEYDLKLLFRTGRHTGVEYTTVTLL
jgi:DNA-binding beta-propeller fold protein YncE